MDVTFEGVVTVERQTTTNDVILRSFDAPSSGGVFALHSTAAGFDAVDVDIDRVPVGLGEQILTTALLSNSTLRIDSWDVDLSGNITHNASATTGVVHSFSSTSGNNGDLLTTVTDSVDTTRLISWQIQADGEIRRSGTRIGRQATAVAVERANDSVGHVNLLYTDETNDLTLRIYDRNYDSNI